MKLLPVILLLALATVASAGLLEMSQELWSRVLNGGYQRVGRLDPLQVPVIKVDQSEGNASYRAILRNLEIGGLNASRIESVQLVRGRLKSNLREREAGYVSYNEQRDLDSIRYRFHTLVKERKGAQGSASEQFERIVEYDPAATRARDEEELLRSAPLDQQRYYANEERRRYRIGQQQQQQRQQQQSQFNGSSQVYYGDMHVAAKPTPRNPASVRVVYTHNYRSQDGQVRPCIGACKPNQDTAGRAETRRGQVQQGPFPPLENSRAQTRIYQEQRYGSQQVAESPAASFSAGVSSGQNQNRFSAQGGSNSDVNYSANYRSGQFSAEGQSGRPSVAGTPRPGQFGAQGGSNSGAGFSANYRSGQFSAEAQSGSPSDDGAPRPGQYGSQRGSNSGAGFSANYRSGQFSAEGQSDNPSEYSGSRPAQFAAKGGNNAGASYNYRSGQFSAEGQTGASEGPTQFSLKGGNGGVAYSGNYRSGQISVESNGGEFYGENGQRQNQYAKEGASFKNPVVETHGSPTGGYEAKAQYGGASFSAGNSGVKGGSSFSGSFRNGQLNAEAQAGSDSDVNSEIKPEKEESDKDFRPMTYFEDPSDQPGVTVDEYGYLCNPEEEHKPTRFQASLRRGPSEEATQPNVEEFDPYKSPLIRMEKQPGYVDIVYASKGQQGSQFRSANLKAASTDDPRVFGLEQLVKEMNSNQRYIIHNFTEGESLRQRNDAARVAAETQRIKDLMRYAKEYQEKQGFYEEGMEFVYHFGNASSRAQNDSVSRRKRQHDKDEEDVMHVIVRMQVPVLSVKADYALMGKVGRQLLRGNGRLDGNFVNVTADFMVELKKVNNNTMIVRAARAKLVSKDRDVKLQGMDEKGPVNDILANGVMAAEAVAAMIADDLATKAISEGDNEGTVYKMYKNLPVAEKS